MYDVIVIQTGYCSNEGGQYKANGTITLVKGPLNIIIDTGSPCEADKQTILKALSEHGLSPNDIHYVVGTHGHVDHIGNLNLFTDPLTTFIVGFDIYRNGSYVENRLNEGESYILDDLVEILPTPGHTCHDISLAIQHPTQGTIVVAGDLFECEEDLLDSDIWRSNSHNAPVQEVNRAKILNMADVIIPGHGKTFSVNKNPSSTVK